MSNKENILIYLQEVAKKLERDEVVAQATIDYDPIIMDGEVVDSSRTWTFVFKELIP